MKIVIILYYIIKYFRTRKVHIYNMAIIIYTYIQGFIVLKEYQENEYEWSQMNNISEYQ